VEWRLLLVELGGTYSIQSVDLSRLHSEAHSFSLGLFQTTVLYFLVDLIWVSRVPICVKSPGTIVKVRIQKCLVAATLFARNSLTHPSTLLQHHLVAIAYLSGPVLWPEFRWFMGACLTVEINTWFLILRRVVFKRQDKLPKALVETISLSFYISWIIIRCVIYPGIMFIFLQMAHREIQITRQFWHWPMLFLPVHFFLCVLNLKWSYDLFQPIVQKWISKDGKEVGVASGL